MQNYIKIDAKKCTKCGEEKHFSEFNSDKSKKFGLSSRCSECEVKEKRRYSKTKSGIVVASYNQQKRRSKNKGWHKPKYSLRELKTWAFSQPKFHNMYDDWAKSGYDKWLKPSIDRIDDDMGYSFDNIQYITWRENDSKGRQKFREEILPNQLVKVAQYTKDGCFIAEYKSIADAARATGANRSHITSCCKGRDKYNSVVGFVWKYINN